MPLPRLVSELPLLQDRLNGLEQLQILPALVTFVNTLSLSLILDKKHYSVFLAFMALRLETYLQRCRTSTTELFHKDS